MVLTNMAKEWKVDITVTGYHGRKGPKEDPTVMGSAIQWMSVHSFTPTMIIKNEILKDTRPDGYYLTICCDGSKKSLKALELASAMKSDKDILHVLICEQSNINSREV